MDLNLTEASPKRQKIKQKYHNVLNKLRYTLFNYIFSTLLLFMIASTTYDFINIYKAEDKMTSTMFNTLIGKFVVMAGYLVLVICHRIMAKQERFFQFDILLAVISLIQMTFTVWGYRSIANSRHTPDDRAYPYMLGQLFTFMNLLPMVLIRDWKLKGVYLFTLMGF